MTLLHVYVGVLLMMVTGTQATCTACGCIPADPSDVAEDDYLFEPLRSEDFQLFQYRMYEAAWDNWNVYNYIRSLPPRYEKPEEPGKQRCRTDFKQIFGYYKANGQVLCYVVYPHIQNPKMAQCFGEQCCGENSFCELCAYVLTKYLVYCDALYTDNDGCLFGTDALAASVPEDIDESDWNSRRKREADDYTFNATLLDVEKRSYCSESRSYFAFKHDYLPCLCTCRGECC
ncbi:uncharacterized protein LOC117335200 [Pecten maximus]|uniref:uncharacterized protein LOC117335200 n=1 Tax=Pecten maximus TaxID=6579 RepID=UPI001457E91C|nr:uncharacterized protein LOC117335200 [Pecten maximus]